jgi:D-xylose transport system ATP-binding protein
MSDEYILRIDNVTKQFPGVTALSGISMNVRKGEIHGICGENGAGKSTLMKILCGVYPRDTYTGRVIFNGEELNFQSGAIRQAIEAGIAIVYQELALIPEMTVGENIFLGHEMTNILGINWDALYSRTKQLLQDCQLDIPYQMKIEDLPVGKQQLVEIAKALSEEAKLLILDEPTSALTDKETVILHHILRRLKERGVTCLYITHKLEEFFVIADTVTVFRDGQVIDTKPASELSLDKMISLMVGRDMKERFPPRNITIGEDLLTVKDLVVEDPARPGHLMIKGGSLRLRKGEVLGIAGLMGSGRSELVMALFGAYGKIVSGEVRIKGQPVRIKGIRDAMNHGISLVPEDRKKQGLLLEQTILKNISLPNMNRFSGFGRINHNHELQESQKFAKALSLKAPNLFVPVLSLSGGNQQKVVISKWLMTEPKILILDDPTRGIDVGAKYEIYKIINQLAEQGVAIILISSEMEEILGMADRIMVMSSGKSAGTIERAGATQEIIMTMAAGLMQKEAV